ncbi:hypothetical protein TNCV_3866981 [Trichonephila clavipes]|nr:hypothetical protein TNCV_3866981 [Trichonephila clavipes]
MNAKICEELRLKENLKRFQPTKTIYFVTQMSSRLVSHQIVVFLIDLGSPPIPIIALWTTKGDFRAISLFGNDKIKKREHLATLSINRLDNSGHEFKESMGRAS